MSLSREVGRVEFAVDLRCQLGYLGAEDLLGSHLTALFWELLLLLAQSPLDVTQFTLLPLPVILAETAGEGLN